MIFFVCSSASEVSACSSASAFFRLHHLLSVMVPCGLRASTFLTPNLPEKLPWLGVCTDFVVRCERIVNIIAKLLGKSNNRLLKGLRGSRTCRSA